MTATATESVTKGPAAEKRVKAASRRVREFNEKAEQARLLRDTAVVSLHAHEGWPPVECYRLIGVSRGLFVRMMDRARTVAQETGQGIPKVANAQKVAAKAARDLNRYEGTLLRERDARDEDAEAMLNGRIRKADGTVYRNADLARLTGLTTARVAQLRQGTR
jgi:hypothetical protein